VRKQHPGPLNRSIAEDRVTPCCAFAHATRAYTRDRRDVRELIEKTLRRYGYTVVVASNGSDAAAAGSSRRRGDRTPRRAMAKIASAMISAPRPNTSGMTYS
jgi:hypothetical protein